MPQVKETPSVFTERFVEVESKGLETAATLPLRRKALGAFEETGVPTPRHEEWKYTDLRDLKDWAPKYARADQLDSSKRADAVRTAMAGVLDTRAESEGETAEPIRMVFVDGIFSTEHSNLTTAPTGSAVVGEPLSQALAERGEVVRPLLGSAGATEGFIFALLNTALHQDGGFIHVPRGPVLDRPIHLVHVSSADSDINTSHPRNLIVIDENAEARVLEDYVSLGDAPFFTNPMTEIVLASNATLDHYRFVRENNAVTHIAAVFAMLERDAHLITNNVSRGGKLIRNDLRVYLGGSGSECVLNGLNVANGKQLMDDHTSVIHAVPRCFSREFYRSVLDDEAQGVFNGKVFVHEDAQKSDGVQENKGLILSSKALMNTKPQLEISADDVKCTHGATIGQLDRDAMFYLRSRGLSKGEARKILVHAFAHDIIERMKYEPARQLATDLLSDAVFLP
jgi:Fe-S cluster assembly protein SufD